MQLVKEGRKEDTDKPVRGAKTLTTVFSRLRSTVVENKSITAKLSSFFHPPARHDLHPDNTGYNND